MSFLPSPGCSADDRETPLIAVQDVFPLVSAFSDSSMKMMQDVDIYDPYYCKGAIREHLLSLGCNRRRIHNDPVDCYAAQKNKAVPLFDVLISNPPYSGDHIQRCIHYAVASAKPWALLLPSNVFLRPWFGASIKDQKVWFIAPHERYGFEYDPATDNILSSEKEKHVPFVTMWYVGGMTDELREALLSLWPTGGRSCSATLAQSADLLPRRIKKLLPFAKVIEIISIVLTRSQCFT